MIEAMAKELNIEDIIKEVRDEEIVMQESASEEEKLRVLALI